MSDPAYLEAADVDQTIGSYLERTDVEALACVGITVPCAFTRDLNASMAVIRNRWPNYLVELEAGLARIFRVAPARGERDATSEGEADVSTEALARALLAAMERER